MNNLILRSRFVFVCWLIFIFQIAASQDKTNGTLRGVVTDSETGEAIVGANISVEGTKLGAASDLEGKYVISLPAGKYSLFVSALSYEKKHIIDVNIEAESELKLFIELQSSAIKEKEVVVEAKASTSYEATLLTKQKNAPAISEGISAEQIKKAPDATSGDALRRLTGVTLVDNKFIFIRGTTERYNQTTLNGASVASTDPDRKSFSFDMLPSNLIDNTMITKSASPELRGDFSGGLVQITTLDFPGKFLLKVSLGTSRNTETTGKNFLTQQGGRSDWLGIDDGIRNHAMPVYKGIGFDQSSFMKSVPNTWSPQSRTAPLPAIFSLAIGDAFNFDDNDNNGSELGVVAAISYRNSFQRNIMYQNPSLANNLSDYLTNASIYKYSMLAGAIANLSYRYNAFHRISFKNNFNRTADQEVKEAYIFDHGNNYDNYWTISTWTQRSIYTGQITGEHQFPAIDDINIAWNISVSNGDQQTPDKKEVVYQRTHESPDPLQVGPAYRTWITLHDRNNSFSTDITIPINKIKIKSGLFFEMKKTDYTTRAFGITIDQFWRHPTSIDLMQQPLETIFDSQNFGPTGPQFLVQEVSKPTDSYRGNSTLGAGYILVDVPLTIQDQNFRFIGGLRTENYSVHIIVPTDLETNSTSMGLSPFSRKVDYLPSINLTYHVIETLNFRYAFSKSLNRPEFRELAPMDIYDYTRHEHIAGNSGLRRAIIINNDLRLEYFPSAGELIAVSAFTKRISDAIEESVDMTADSYRSWINSPDRAKCDGWELEIRKHFGFITNYLSNLSISGNYSRVFSTVHYSILEYPGRDFTRQLQGQSPYVINAGISFTEPNFGTSINILYNRFGERINAVGSVYEDRLKNIYEEPVDIIDLSINQTLPLDMEIKLSIKNLNGKDRILLVDENSTGVWKKGLYQKEHTGSTYGIQVSKTF